MIETTEDRLPELRAERIEIDGGRYLIYYTFSEMTTHPEEAPAQDQ